MLPVVDVHCSQLSRPMSCAGFLSFKDLVKTEAGPAAAEGTACGELLEHKIYNRRDPSHVIPAVAKNGVAFDRDMQFYTDGILPLIAVDATCEQKINWQTRSGIWIMGQYDASFIRDGKLYIDDLKYGWNIVDVEKNWQLLGYAIGQVIKLNAPVTSVVMRIHQPRPHHELGTTRSWEISLTELWKYREMIETRMSEIAAGNKELSTGRQCKYCPAAAEACPAFNRSFYASLDYVLNHHIQDNINDHEVANQLDLIARAKDVLKIKADSLEQLAIHRIKSGGLIPGYMSEAGYGDRKWKPGINAEVIKVMTGIDITETSMLSPAKAERQGVPKDLVKTFVDRHFVGQRLVRKDGNKLGDLIFNKPVGG